MTDMTIQLATETDPNLLRMLDQGLDDFEAGRVMNHDDAVKEIRRIRQARRESQL